MDNNIIATHWAFPQIEFLSLGAWPFTHVLMFLLALPATCLPFALCPWNTEKKTTTQ